VSGVFSACGVKSQVCFVLFLILRSVDRFVCWFFSWGERSRVVLFGVCGSLVGKCCYFVFPGVFLLGFVNLSGSGVRSWSSYKMVRVRSVVSMANLGFRGVVWDGRVWC
jgi:hypothetical protein